MEHNEMFELNRMPRNYVLSALIATISVLIVLGLNLYGIHKPWELLLSPVFSTSYTALLLHIAVTYFFKKKRESGEKETLKTSIRYGVTMNVISFGMLFIHVLVMSALLRADVSYNILLIYGYVPLIVYTMCVLACTIRYAIKASLRLNY